MWKWIVALLAVIAVAEYGAIACYTPRDPSPRCPIRHWSYTAPCVDDPTEDAFFKNCPCYPTGTSSIGGAP